MEILSEIEKACKDNNHDRIKHLIDSSESYELKKGSLLKVIEHYEGQSLFPSGYYLWLIKSFLQNHDLSAAMTHILKCCNAGMSQEKLSRLIFENLIEPMESHYKRVFDANMQLLRDHGVLFSDREFNFDRIKNDLSIIADCRTISAEHLLGAEKKRIFLADVVNTGMILDILKKDNIVFLAYDDFRKFYYMLFFEDISKLSKYIERKILLFFVGDIKELLNNFFSNMLIPFPQEYLDLSSGGNYRKIINSIVEDTKREIFSYLQELQAYYRGGDYAYYKNLLSGDPSHVKIVLITSESTQLNKSITRNWQKAFSILGYQTRLMIEKEPYEGFSKMSAVKTIYEYKPDIVFFINWTPKSIFGNCEIGRNLLWIMRYRDVTDISREAKGFDYGNMFVLPMKMEWADELKNLGMPPIRILYAAEGIDIEAFKKTNAINEQFACDVVSVNNTAGSEGVYLKMLLEKFGDSRAYREIINKLYSELIEMADTEQFLFFNKSFHKMIIEKHYLYGIDIDYINLGVIADYCRLVMSAFYRARIIEWILDSGITKNIKLWGSGWYNIERLRSFHMGTAQHGKQLSEIYQNSRIALSENGEMTLHERNFEIMASGGFPLIKNIEPENGETIDSITNYFKENEEVVLFYNKDDLLNKIQYYLDNQEERERIAENGRQVVINNFSHVAIAKKTMDFIKSYYLRKEQRA